MALLQQVFGGGLQAIPEARISNEIRQMPAYQAGDLAVNLIEEQRRDVGCHNCAALCCRREVEIPLTPQEALHAQEAGTTLALVQAVAPKRRLLPMLPPKVRPSIYKFESDCANKKGNACGVFGEDPPKRPQICHTFRAGSYACRRLRYQGAIDTPEQWAAYLVLNTEV